jgi:putative DNA-invertase from lambdoid prophage Rac
MKAAIYARVSTEEQTTDNQIPVLEKWAKARGWEIIKIYSEEASAWRAGHQKELALKDTRHGEFDLVLVWALDRLTRVGISAIFQLLDSFAAYG